MNMILKKFSLTAADELRLGDTFCRAFYGLTEADPADRFSDWSEAISVMDEYLKEDMMMKQSALSGKRRSLTTSYDFDVYSDVDEKLVQKARKKKRKKKRKVLPSSEIRSRMRSEAPATRLQARSPQSIRKKSKKSDNHTMLIATSVVIILGLFLFLVFASTFSNKQETVAQAENTENLNTKTEQEDAKKPVKQETSKPKSEEKAVVANKLDTAKSNLSAEDEFKELTFEVREFTIRKDWDKALAMCALYDGPYSEEVAKLKAEIERKKLGYLQAKIDKTTENLPTKPSELPGPPQEVNLEEVVDYIYNGQYELALGLFLRLKIMVA